MSAGKGDNTEDRSVYELFQLYSQILSLLPCLRALYACCSTSTGEMGRAKGEHIVIVTAETKYYVADVGSPVTPGIV